MTGGYGADEGLLTLQDGKAPECRMKDAAHTQDFVYRMRQNDTKRSKKRALVSGLVQGNPPYRASKLLAAGRADACNVNWGTSRQYMESGSGAFYDLASEAPGIVQIRTSLGNPQEQDDWSHIMSKEADAALTSDPVWDYEIQQSQWEMTLHGRGPLFFEDPFKVIPRAVHDGDLCVPERTKADTEYWEVCSIDVDYYPPEIWAFIKNEEKAKLAGWNPEFTKKVIANAMDIKEPNATAFNFEFYQQELKNNSLSYYDDSKVCKLAHVFWKEFSGRITHAIIEREESATQKAEYLFIYEERYANFREALHPMYIDRGNGGFHHSVTGLGTKQFGPMEYENRLLCNLMDKAFAPKILFKPTMSEAGVKFQLTPLGDYGLMPKGWEVEQNPIQGFLSDGLAMFKASSQLMQSNLSSYRQQAPTKMEGNPVTAKQVQLEASQSAALSKTTYNRYYKQLDFLYSEIVRRLCNLNSTDDLAKGFQERCKKRGVPETCFGRIESVFAVRVIGQGSPFLRKQSVDSVGAIVQRLPEDGQANWLNDKIAVEAGSAAVARYNPPKVKGKLPEDQQFEAMVAVTMAKVGVPPIVTASQNPVTFAATFLSAGVQALQSLQQGANPAEVVKFLSIAGPAIQAHLQRFAQDPLRQGVYKQISEQSKQLAAATDKLVAQLNKQKQQNQAQQQKTQAAMSDQQIKAQKVQGDLVLKAQKQKATLAMQAQKHKQSLAIQDANAASAINRNNRLAAFNTGE
jgi:hypothetical protein